MVYTTDKETICEFGKGDVLMASVKGYKDNPYKFVGIGFFSDGKQYAIGNDIPDYVKNKDDFKDAPVKFIFTKVESIDALICMLERSKQALKELEV